jgi:hypothetical protein
MINFDRAELTNGKKEYERHNYVGASKTGPSGETVEFFRAEAVTKKWMTVHY